jgi:hypothetical protein
MRPLVTAAGARGKPQLDSRAWLLHSDAMPLSMLILATPGLSGATLPAFEPRSRD